MKTRSDTSRITLAPPYVLLLAFTILVIMHNVFTPVFEAPDEVWHYNYVRWIAEGHGLPSLTDNESGAHQEAAQPPLYYLAAALLSRPFPDDDLHGLFWGNPGFGFQSPGTTADNKNMLVHTARENFPWRGAVAALHAARFTSLVFGIWTLLAVWQMGLEVFQNRHGALIMASLLAFHPQFVFMCSVVSNDSATAALCSTALLTLFRVIDRHSYLKEIVFCGLAVGAAALTKTSAVLLIPLAMAAFLYNAVRNKTPLHKLVKYLLMWGGCVILIGGWWYTRNWILYGDPMGFSSHIDTPWGRTSTASYIDLLPEIPMLVRSFWAAYGWGHVTWPDAIPYILTAFSVFFILAGLLDTVKNRTHLKTAPFPYLTLAGMWLGMVTLALLSWMRQVEAPHGRLMFPAIGAWVLIVAYGLVLFYQRGGVYRLFARLFIVFLAVLCALAPGARIVPAFAQPRLRDSPGIPNADSTAALYYSDLAKVFDVSIKPGYHPPGDTIRVTACWEALQPIHVDYTVFVHLIGPENIRTAERHTYPGLGRYPTTLWETGKYFCDVYDLTIEDWAPAPVLYNLEIGLFDTKTGDRLSVTNSQGQNVEPPIVGTVPVVAGQEIDAPSIPMNITFDDTIQLTGVDLPEYGERGHKVEVTLYWQALAQPEPQLRMFVHLWEAGEDEPYTQDDGVPNQDWFPTDVWEKGILVADKHSISIPDSLEPGTYPLWAGIYRASDGSRLHAANPDGAVPDNLVMIGEIEIKE